jgi:hypothetical protein
MVLVQEVYELRVVVSRIKLGGEITIATLLLGVLWSGPTC